MASSSTSLGCISSGAGVIGGPTASLAASEMAGVTAAGTSLMSIPSTRRANLEFPPPPPYPPPHNGIAAASCSTLQLQHQQQQQHQQDGEIHRHTYHHRALIHSPRSLHDYSYAYYEPGPSRTHSPHSPTTCSAASALGRLAQHPQDYQLLQQAQAQSLQQLQLQQEQQSYQALQAYQLHRQDPHKRHTYVTRYGTEENIYEEISEIGRQCRRALHGSRRSLVAEEVRRVQSRHRRVLGELNLSVEAMLMPTIADQTSNDGSDDPDHQVASGNASTDELLLNHHHDELLPSPVGCAADLDSGFSGSSSASYRSGLGSLRRGIGRTSTPELLSNGQLLGCNNHYHHQQQQQQRSKTKAAMIWKKGWKSWKKLQGLGGSNSQKTELQLDSSWRLPGVGSVASPYASSGFSSDFYFKIIEEESNICIYCLYLRLS